ncbi:MAG TPA: general stress protein [Steroidobacteraceae bacterium]
MTKNDVRVATCCTCGARLRRSPPETAANPRTLIGGACTAWRLQSAGLIRKRRQEMANSSNGQQSADTSRRGFASMDEDQQRQIASKGGQSQGKENNPGNFANDRERAAEAGRKGGESQGKENNPGNFANDREKAAEAGRHGGQARGGSSQ